MKKVLFVATVFRFFNFEKSDMEILSSMGFEIHTASNMYGYKDLGDDGTLNSIHTTNHQIDFGRSPLSKQSVIAYKQLKKLLNENHYDLIHCHTPVAAAILRVSAIRARKRGAKVIYTDHGFHFHKKTSLLSWLLYCPIEFVLAKVTDCIITINKEDLNLIKKFPIKEVRYIPGVGVDTSFISNLAVNKSQVRKSFNIPEDAFLIMSIGELCVRKNHEVIIKAISKLSDNEIYYLIFGSGDRLDYLKRLTNELGLNNRVIFAGKLPHVDVLKYAHVSDIGAIPSLIEGLGLAGIETMAAGKPLIGSNIHGINDYLINGVTGISCSPHDIDGFASAIEKLKSDKAFYSDCSNAASQKSKEFDINIVRDLMRKYFSEFVRES